MSQWKSLRGSRQIVPANEAMGYVAMVTITGTTSLGCGLLSKTHVKFHVSKQGFSSMASDWLAAVLPANQMPGMKIFVN